MSVIWSNILLSLLTDLQILAHRLSDNCHFSLSLCVNKLMYILLTALFICLYNAFKIHSVDWLLLQMPYNISLPSGVMV